MISKIAVQQQFKQRSDWRGLLTLGRDLLFLGLAWAAAAQWGANLVVSLAVIWFVGALQFALGEALLHEASHGNLFKTPWLNKAVGHLLGATILTTLQAWRQEHSSHHGHLLTDKDHLTHDYKAYQLADNIHPFYLWIARPLLGWVGLQWLQSEGPSLWKHKGVFLFYSVLALLAHSQGYLLFFVLYWLLPLCWAYPAFLYWSEITDHHLAQSSTRTNSSFLWNAFFHNGGYHWVHHEYPFIPWYLLPQANAQLARADVDQIASWWSMYQLLLLDYKNK